MQKKDTKSTLLSATFYVAIIVGVVLYNSWKDGTPISQTALLFFIGAALFLGYQWIMYFKNRKKDR